MIREANGGDSILGGRLALAVKRLRQANGMTQEALSKAASVHQTTICLLERNRNISIEKLERVAEALGYSFRELVDFADDSGKEDVVKKFCR